MGMAPARPKGSTPEYSRPQTRLLGKLAKKSIDELIEEHQQKEKQIQQNNIIQNQKATMIQRMFRKRLNEPTPSEISALITAKPEGASGEDFLNQFVDTYYHVKPGRPKKLNDEKGKLENFIIH